MRVDLRKAGWRQLNTAATKLWRLMLAAEESAARAGAAHVEVDRLWWAGRADGLKLANELLMAQLRRARRARR